MTRDDNIPIAPASSKPESKSVDWSQLGWGIAIMTVGVLLTLDRMMDFDYARFWRYSPIILILFGLAGLLRGKSPKARSDSWFVLGAGIYVLVNLLEPWGFYWGNSWPLILILIGLSMLIDPEKPKQRADSLWLLGIGAFFLLVQGDFDFAFEDVWPILLIAGGLAIVWSSLIRRGNPASEKESRENETPTQGGGQ